MKTILIIIVVIAVDLFWYAFIAPHFIHRHMDYYRDNGDDDDDEYDDYGDYED